MKKTLLLFIATAFSICCLIAQEQSRMPEVMTNGTIAEQLDYIQQRTNIYNNFRAVREDIFQSLKRNTLDSLIATNNKVKELENQITGTNKGQDSLNVVLNKTREDLNYAIKNRNNLLFLGISMNKILYNVIMWSLVIGLIVLIIFLGMLHLRNHKITRLSRKELSELKDEFESYRKTSREKLEKLVIDHFNEIKKLKGER